MMDAAQKVRTNVYLDRAVKDKAKELFKQYNLSLSDALNIFLSQSVLEQGMPFEVKLPKDIELIKADEYDYELIKKSEVKRQSH